MQQVILNFSHVDVCDADTYNTDISIIRIITLLIYVFVMIVFSNDVARHRPLWRERLDRHQELIAQLYSEKVILEGQKDAFLADLHAYLNADSCQQNADDCRIRRIKLNETIINCVIDKPARQIKKSMKILKALEDTCQQHLFDIFTKNTGG